ncbi:MAG: right-handed parallel beta-helix repeat-containing protein [Thermoplasmatales archaeon]|nr:right-handed parallel beta-helix repeat-containing protein [Thermoplasmatales archaeon]
MRNKKFVWLGDSGVSEVVGTILLLAIAISTFSVVGIYVFSINQPENTPNVTFVGYINEAEHIIIEHRGGSELNLDKLKIVIWKGEIKSKQYSFNSEGNLIGENATFKGDGNDRWNIGEYIDINGNAIFGNITFWQISAIIVDEESNSIIFAGILREGIVNYVPPVAKFRYAPLSPKTLEIVEFNASQSYDPDGGEIISYRWDFGDGNIGYGKVVLHRYSSSGIYNITLTVTDDEYQTATATSGYGFENPPVNVTENQKPVANFSWDNNSGEGIVSFLDSSFDTDGYIVSCYWNFGDGATSTEQNPVHYYNRSGTYTVTLVVTDNNGATNSTSYNIIVPNILPFAIFSYFPQQPTTKNYVFFDASGSYDRDGEIVSYSWDFDNDGEFDDAIGVNPYHMFSSSGNYTVKLKVMDNEGGIGIANKTIVISSPFTYRSVLVVDNTPASPRNWDGISNILVALSRLGVDYSTGKAIDSWKFVGGSEKGKNITATLLDEYDIVIWSCGDFPGDGGKAINDGINNTWSTSMTEGADDTSDHVYEIKEHLNHNGTILLTGTYVVRDLQNYSGNRVNEHEIWLGETLGLIEPIGGINSGYHSGITGYFANDYYPNPGTFSYGPMNISGGILKGVIGTSSYSSTYGLANIVITSPMKIYELNKNSSALFNYSLISEGKNEVINESFESSFPPNGWEEYILGFSNPGWQSLTLSGRKCAYHDETVHWWQNCNDWLVSPSFVVPSNGILEFYEWNRYMSYYTYHGVWISTGSRVPPTDFVELAEMSVSTNQNWVKRTIDLSYYAGQNVCIAFVYKGGDGAEWAVDDIKVYSRYVPVGEYAIDALRGANRSIVLGFDLNSNAITNESREAYLRNVLNWMAEGVGYTTVVWVDDDAPLEWYDEKHLRTIQEGVDAVCVGGTVYVYSGNYNGALINKSVNLVGMGNPKISMGGLRITADWVIIEGFKINATSGIFIDNCSRIYVNNCSISNATYGISFYGSYNSSISNTTISNNTYGIIIRYSSFIDIVDNEIHENIYGIWAENVVRVNIRRNEINSNSEGLHFYKSDNSIIRDNNIYSNTNFGIKMISTPKNNYIANNAIHENGYGIYLDLSTRNIIQGNDIYSNTNDGIYLVSGSSQNTIWFNEIWNNNFGIYLSSSSNNYISSNNITLCKNNGIYLKSSGTNIIFNNTISSITNEGFHIISSDLNFISENVIYNATHGIRISESRENIIENNTLYKNRNSGIYLERPNEDVCDNNTLMNNSIYSNSECGIFIYSASGNILFNNQIYNNSMEGIKLKSRSDLNNISNNLIDGNEYGISIQMSSYNILENNTIINSSESGIYMLDYSSQNTLYLNTIKQNKKGLEIIYSNNNNVSNNSIIFNEDGINISYGYNNKIYRNNISSNANGYGIYIIWGDANIIDENIVGNNKNGIYLFDCGGTGNNLEENEIFSSIEYGIYMENSKIDIAGNNQIIKNKIYSNGMDAVFLKLSNINSIQQNSIYSNNGNGIYLFASNTNSIKQNNIYSNNGNGIYMVASNSNYLQSNNISFNKNGIYMMQSSQGDSYPIRGNLIWNNTLCGIIMDSSESNYLGEKSTPNKIWNNTYGIIVNNSSRNNEIRYSIIEKNIYGILINRTSTNNKIYETNITENSAGINISSSDCNFNEIYHNNFLNNTLQAWDEGNNSWYAGTEGNYWSDRPPEQTYYNIPPYSAQDRYPLSSVREWWL